VALFSGHGVVTTLFSRRTTWRRNGLTIDTVHIMTSPHPMYWRSTVCSWSHVKSMSLRLSSGMLSISVYSAVNIHRLPSCWFTVEHQQLDGFNTISSSSMIIQNRRWRLLHLPKLPKIPSLSYIVFLSNVAYTLQNRNMWKCFKELVHIRRHVRVIQSIIADTALGDFIGRKDNWLEMLP